MDGTSNTAFVGEKAIRKDAGALVSLDVELPSRGREFLFTTPRGEVEITAQAISEPLVERLIRAGWVLLAIVVCYLGYRLIAAVGVSALTGRVAGIGLVVVGLVSLVTCIFPLAGLVAIVLGAILTARWFLVERRLAAA
jgi:hypothetical protein